MGPRLNLIVPQSKPSRPDSMLMTITGSIPMFETEEGEEQETSLLNLPPPPPSPPASEASDFGEGEREDDVPPTVPMTAPPPIPDMLAFPLTEYEGQSTGPILPPTSEVPDDLPLLPLPSEESGPQNEFPTSKPPPIPILDDSILHSPDLPALPPPLLPDTPTEISESLPDEDSSRPPGFIQLEVDLKKRAKGGLGVTVEASDAPTNNLFMIRRIIAAGAAAKDGRLRPGDRLVAVNGKNLAGLHHAAVLQELNNAPKECHLTIWRDPTAVEAGDATPPSYPISRHSGSRSSLIPGSDDEQHEGLVTKRSLSISSLENSPLAVAKKLSVGKGMSPRGSPLVHNRLSLSSAVAAAASTHTPPAVNGTSPLTKRWSAEATIFTGPAGELIDLSPPPISINLSPGGANSPVGGQTPELLTHSGGVNGMRDENDDEFYHTETPPTTTPPQPPSTPPPPIPLAPPPTMHRGMKLDLTEVAAAMKIAADEIISSSEDEDEGVGGEEAPPPLPQTTPPPPPKEEAPPPLPQTTPPPTKVEAEKEPTFPPSTKEEVAPPTMPQTTPPTTEAEKGALRIESDEVKCSENEKKTVEVDRPKSLGPVPKGKRLEGAPFEIEVSKGILGGLGMTLCENELGMIAIKALTSRSPITKEGNIK